MEVTIAMGHFCEIHGPCVVICTQRMEKVPKVPPPSLNVPVCDACESIELDLAYGCQDEKLYYVSTRTALDAGMARLMKEAVTKTLSNETFVDEGKDKGTMYFGDNVKGHVIAHMFTIKDSLARGFKRKYCIVVLGKHQIPLMHHYNFIEQNLEEISTDLVQKSDKIYDQEKHLRDRQRIQGATSRKPVLRSLKQLVGEPYVFAHLHLWFVFLLRAEIYRIVPHEVPECPVDCPAPKELRELQAEMPKDIFRTVMYCILIGIKVEEVDVDIIQYFRQLLPKGFILTTSGEVCRVSKKDGVWEMQFKGTLPKNLPRMFLRVEEALDNKIMPVSALKWYLMAISLRWFNIACVISWSTGPCDDLMRSLEVHKCDMPLLSYWIPQSHACVKIIDTDWFRKADEGPHFHDDDYGKATSSGAGSSSAK